MLGRLRAEEILDRVADPEPDSPALDVTLFAGLIGVGEGFLSGVAAAHLDHLVGSPVDRLVSGDHVAFSVSPGLAINLSGALDSRLTLYAR